MRKKIKTAAAWFFGLAALTGAAVAVGQVMSGVYNSVAPTCTNGKPCVMQVDANGQMKSTVSGTVNGGGSAASPNAGVMTVQGISGMTNVNVDVQDVDAINAVLHASGTETNTGTGAAATTFTNTFACWFYAHFSACATDAGDTIDVYVQTTFDGGTTWVDFVHFAQVTGTTTCNATTPIYGFSSQTSGGMSVTLSAALGASSIRSTLPGTQLRARWDITDTGGDDASFTFQVRSQCFLP